MAISWRYRAGGAGGHGGSSIGLHTSRAGLKKRLQASAVQGGFATVWAGLSRSLDTVE
jgi:hypothetical protein